MSRQRRTNPHLYDFGTFYYQYSSSIIPADTPDQVRRVAEVIISQAQSFGIPKKTIHVIKNILSEDEDSPWRGRRLVEWILGVTGFPVLVFQSWWDSNRGFFAGAWGIRETIAMGYMIPIGLARDNGQKEAERAANDYFSLLIEDAGFNRPYCNGKCHDSVSAVSFCMPKKCISCNQKPNVGCQLCDSCMNNLERCGHCTRSLKKKSREWKFKSKSVRIKEIVEETVESATEANFPPYAHYDADNFQLDTEIPALKFQLIEFLTNRDFNYLVDYDVEADMGNAELRVLIYCNPDSIKWLIRSFALRNKFTYIYWSAEKGTYTIRRKPLR